MTEAQSADGWVGTMRWLRCNVVPVVIGPELFALDFSRCGVGPRPSIRFFRARPCAMNDSIRAFLLHEAQRTDT